MIKIQSFFSSFKIASAVAGRTPALAPKAEPKVDEEETRPADRTIHDTVNISGGGKMANLARGRELANEIRSKSVDENFATDLRKALEDVFRITRLFRENMKAAFKTRI